MTPQDFAQRIKAKYPDYANLDDMELTQRVIAKYPQYASQVRMPQAPQKGFYQKTLDFAQKLPTAPLGNAIGNSVRAFAADFRGDHETARQLDLENQRNFGKIVGSTVYSVATPASFAVGAAPSLAASAARFGGLGAAQAGGASAAKGNDATRVVSDATLGGIVGVGAAGVSHGISKLLQNSGSKIMTSVIKPSKADIEDGFSIDTIKKYNLGGSLKQSVEKTDKVMDDLTRQLNQKLASTNARIKLSDALQKTTAQLSKNSLSNFGSQGSMANALKQLENEIVAAGDDISIPEAQTVKRAAGHLGAWVFGQNDPDATARQKVYTTFYRILKEQIEQNSPEGVKEINKELSKLIPVMNALIKRVPVAERNAAISLTDVISLAGATIEPTALALTAINRASRSGVVGNALLQAGSKVTGSAIAPTATSLLGSSLPAQKESSTKPLSTSSSEFSTAARKLRQDIIDNPPTPGGTAKAVMSKFFRKQPPHGLLKDMARFIDYVRLEKGSGKPHFEANVRDAVAKFGINPNQSNASLVKTFEQLLDKAKYGR